MDMREVARIVLADLDRAKDYFEETVEPALIKRHDVYTASKDRYSDKYPVLSEQSDFVSYDMYAYVQWAKPAIIDSFFGPTQTVSIVGQGNEDESAADIMNKLITWQVQQVNHGYLLFDRWIQDALVYEMGILKCWWDRKTARTVDTLLLAPQLYEQVLADPRITVVSAEPANEFGDMNVAFEHDVVEENRPVLDHVSPFDLRWLPEAKTLQESDCVAQRMIVSADFIQRRIDDGTYDKKEAELAMEESEGVEWTNYEIRNNPDLKDGLPEEKEKARRKFEMYECYVRYDDDGDGKLNDMIVTVLGKHVIRTEKNTFGRVPFFTLSPHHDPDKVFCDLSLSDVAGELQDLRTAMMRQVMVNVSLNNTPRQFINEDVVEIGDILSNSNYIRVHGSPNEAMATVPTASLTSVTMPLFEYFKTLDEEWTGKTRYNQGTDANSLNKTATGINLIMQAANQRMNHVIKLFAETGVVQLYRFIVELNQRFIDQSQVIRVFNKPLRITPDDISGSLDIVVACDVGLNERNRQITALQQYLKEFYPLGSQLGICDPKDLSRVAVRYFEHNGWTDASEFIRSPEEIEAKQREMMEQQIQNMQRQAQQKQFEQASAGNMQGVMEAQAMQQGISDAQAQAAQAQGGEM